MEIEKYGRQDCPVVVIWGKRISDLQILTIKENLLLNSLQELVGMGNLQNYLSYPAAWQGLKIF